MTLAEAAAFLDVTPQRVNQMLRSGMLAGPVTGAGRAKPNAGRVWVSSAQAVLGARRVKIRSESPPSDRVRELEDRVALMEARFEAAALAAAPNEAAEAVRRESAARDSAVYIKAAADAALSALEVERTRVRQLEEEVSRLRALEAEQRRRAELAERVSGLYSDGLTQLLAPNDAEELRP